MTLYQIIQAIRSAMRMRPATAVVAHPPAIPANVRSTTYGYWSESGQACRETVLYSVGQPDVARGLTQRITLGRLYDLAGYAPDPRVRGPYTPTVALKYLPTPAALWRTEDGTIRDGYDVDYLRSLAAGYPIAEGGILDLGDGYRADARQCAQQLAGWGLLNESGGRMTDRHIAEFGAALVENARLWGGQPNGHEFVNVVSVSGESIASTAAIYDNGQPTKQLLAIRAAQAQA